MLRAYLYGVSPHDTLAFAAVAAIVSAAAFVAAFQPARRALRIDPAVTLREE